MRVVVAMSGGVDSSATAAILKEAGHEVVGMTLRLWSHEASATCGSCCSPDDVDDARAVAQQLDVPFYVVKAEELFRERVVGPFVDAYLNGRTPIPCVACNDVVKFGFLLHRARQLGAKLATGHYARVVEQDGRFELLRALDEAKDQSYFLFTLGQAELKDVLFPVGGLSKAEVRRVALRHGLRTSAKKESMEICFVPDGDYASFVEKEAGPQPPGDIVSASGRVLGRHQGIHHFTVGQRRGLNVASTEALYVERVDAGSGRVIVGPSSSIMRGDFGLIDPRWVAGEAPIERDLDVKIRHRHAGAVGRLLRDVDGGLKVVFAEPQRAVTPGQAAVLYDGTRVLGGGWIR